MHIGNILLESATFQAYQQHFKHISNIHGYVADIFISNIISNMGVPRKLNIAELNKHRRQYRLSLIVF